MTTTFEDVLIELDSKIAEVYDLDLAKEMSDIHIDLSDRIYELDSQYWKLVKALAKTERERDELVRELDVEKRTVKMVFEIGMATAREERKIQDQLDIEKDQIEYDKNYYRDEVYRLRAQNEALTESHSKCIDVIKKLL